MPCLAFGYIVLGSNNFFWIQLHFLVARSCGISQLLRISQLLTVKKPKPKKYQYVFTADEKNVSNCAHWEHQCKNRPIFYLFNTDTNTVTNMNSGTDMDMGTDTETGMVTSTASETTTEIAMNTGTTTDTDTDMVTNTETHIDTDKETGMVMHGHSHGERTRDHADSDTFKSMVTSPSTGTRRDWNDNQVPKVTDKVMETAMETCTVTDTIELRHGHVHRNDHGHCH